MYNIVVLDKNTEKSVQDYSDHVLNEKCFSYLMMLGYIHHVYDGIEKYKMPIIPTGDNATLYWLTRIPSAYAYLVNYAKEVHKEFEFRFEEKHPAFEFLSDLTTPPRRMKVGGSPRIESFEETPPCELIKGANVVINDFNVDLVESYRKEAIDNPLGLPYVFTRRDYPDWFTRATRIDIGTNPQAVRARRNPNHAAGLVRG